MNDYAQKQLARFVKAHKGSNKIEVDIVRVKVLSNLKKKGEAKKILDQLRASIKDPKSPFYIKILEQLLKIETDQQKRFKLYDDYFAKVQRPGERDRRPEDPCRGSLPRSGG